MVRRALRRSMNWVDGDMVGRLFVWFKVLVRVCLCMRIEDALQDVRCKAM